MNKMCYETAFKMLLAANYRGVRIGIADGHWWLEFEDEVANGKSLAQTLDESGILCNEKVYDGPLQALARIDAAVQACNTDGAGLIESTYTDDWYMGDGTPSSDGVNERKEL